MTECNVSVESSRRSFRRQVEDAPMAAPMVVTKATSKQRLTVGRVGLFYWVRTEHLPALTHGVIILQDVGDLVIIGISILSLPLLHLAPPPTHVHATRVAISACTTITSDPLAKHARVAGTKTKSERHPARATLETVLLDIMLLPIKNHALHAQLDDTTISTGN